MKTFTNLFVLVVLASTGLNAQTYDFPAGCTPPELNPLIVGGPQLFGVAELDGAPIPTDDIIYVFNANGGLIGKTPVFTDNPGTINESQAFLAKLNTDEQGNGCPVYVEGADITVVYENLGSDNLQAQNSVFVGVESFGGLLTGPDGDVIVTDTFNFESRFLPVTFASLQARDLGGKVSIEWAAASESGNDYFEVEHGTDIGSFSAVGQVAGAGDSQELLAYDLVHDNPVMGTNYYRIKQVDFEGTFSYSGIVPVEVAGTPSGEITLFPNPAGDYFNLNVGNDWKVEEVNVAVFSAQGRRILEWSQSTEVTRQIFTDAIPAGVYVLRVDGAQRTSTQRLVIE